MLKGCVTAKRFCTMDLWQKLNLNENGITNDYTTLTRENAATIVANAAKLCDINTEYLFAYLNDESDIDKNKLSFVNWASCFGLFDFKTPGEFSPKSLVSVKEAQILTLRLYESLLNLSFEN